MVYTFSVLPTMPFNNILIVVPVELTLALCLPKETNTEAPNLVDLS